MKLAWHLVATLVAGSCLAPPAHAAMRAAALRCEYLTQPLGVDRTAPRLSWIVEADRPDESQTAYRVLVASSPDELARDVGDLWDSGRVTSGDTTAIAYAGRMLVSGQRVWWKVQAFDRDGAAGPWSPPQSWSMGLLSPTDWVGQWIGCDAGRAEAEAVPDPLADAAWIAPPSAGTTRPAERCVFERAITLPADAKAASAELAIAADDHCDVAVNGVEVAWNARWKKPFNAEVSRWLRPGENVVRVTCAAPKDRAAAILASLRIVDAGGRETRVVTDASWRADSAPVTVVGANGVEPWKAVEGRYLLPPPAVLRHEFAVAGGVRRATLYVAALGIADVYLNGRRASDDYFPSGWTDYRIRSDYRTYDVTQMVRVGPNAIGAVVADGWYSGHVGYGAKRRDWYGTHPRVRAQLDLELDDGTHQVVATDGTWRGTCDGPTRVADLLAGESYDARREMPGWSEPNFEAGAWQPADVGAEVSPAMQAHPGQPVRAVREWPARSVAEPSPGVYVVDFGQNLAGVVRLHVRGARAGQTITLRHAERLDADGTIYTANLRSARATDRYTCRGGADVETWSPRFTFHGFQYVEITGLDRAPTVDDVTALALTSDVPDAGSFESSDALLNRLYRNIRQTQAMNFIDVPTDCPQRDERLGWTGDAQVYIRTAASNADVHRFFDKWLVDLADQQRDDGQFPCVAPLREAAGDDGGPAWADAGVICPWAIFDVYGDRDLLARQYPSMQKYLDFCERRSTPEGLPPATFHCFGDWLNVDADTPKDLIYVAYFAHDADLMSRAAAALGKDDDAWRYAALFGRLRRTFRTAFVAADGKIKGDTQCGYVLAIAFGLLDAEGTREAGRRLVADIEARGDHLSTGFVGTKDLMFALDRIGRDDVAFRLLHQDTYPSWLFSIRQGNATTIWERWNAWTPDGGFGDRGMNSFAHYSFGAVYGWMAETIGGIRNDGDAYRRIVIEPSLDPKLSFARTSYASIRGTIATDWSRDGDRATLTVTIPANTTATVRLPTTRPADVRVDGAAGAVAAERDGRVEVAVGSGVRTFTFDVAR